MGTSSAKLRLKRGLSYRYDGRDNVVAIGVYPPKAIRIDRPPQYLPALLAAWSEPNTIQAIRDRVACPDPVEFTAVVEDLVTLGVIEPVHDVGRYDRHQLYFDFFDIARDEYVEVLSKKKVGIIGTGGIGSTCAMLLGAAGVGALVFSDGDRLEESNLTRSVLFDESDVGQLKVLAAQTKLTARNHKLSLSAVPARIDSAEFVLKHFADCDLLLLSADSPKDVHAWVNVAALEMGVPYTTAGYVETFGSIGPFIVPGSTGCFDCGRLNGIESLLDMSELNSAHQAPSYGPLNTLVSAITTNETLRYLLGLPFRTLGTQMLVDSSDYSMTFHRLQAHADCRCRSLDSPVTATADGPDGEQRVDHFEEIAKDYERFRDSTSLNALVVDEVVLSLAADTSTLKILDVGCGTGTLSIALAKLGHWVTAIDSSPSMLNQLRHRISREHELRLAVIEGDAANRVPDERYDRVLLNLVLDHIADPSTLLHRIRHCIAPNGKVIVVVPHPFKDSGRWQKHRVDGEWRFGDFVVSNYFYEGEIQKSREDDAGNLTVRRIKSHKRTLQTYFQLLTSARFHVYDLIEPQPASDRSPCGANWEKSSRIPYFLVMCCAPRLDSTQ